MTITFEREPATRNQQLPGWFWIDNEIIDRYVPRIGVYGVAVYAVLARMFSGPERGSAGFAEIAGILGISRRAVIYAMQKLCDVGLIAKQENFRETYGGNGANAYVLCEPPTPSPTPQERGASPALRAVHPLHPGAAECTTDTPRGDSPAPGGCTTCTPVERERSATDAPRTLYIKPEENQLKPRISATGTNSERASAPPSANRGGTEI